MARRLIAAAVGAGAALGLAAAPARHGEERVARVGFAQRDVLWVWSEAAAVGAQVGDVAERVAAAVVGEVEAVEVVGVPGLGWWEAGELGEGARVVVGVDLNELRARWPERFADQRLNEALGALGLANARGVVVEVGEGMEVVVSYRSWAADRGERVSLTRAGTVGPEGGVAIQARWGEWIERGVECHRAMLDALDRSPFEARRGAWDRRHGSKLRQVIAALEGPIVFGQAGGEGYALVRLGARADVEMVMRQLAIVVGPVCEGAAWDAEAGVGRGRIGVLAGTAYESVEWGVMELGGREWVVVTREGAGEMVRAALSEPRP